MSRFNLPSRGQRDWDDELANAFSEIDSSLQVSEATANAASNKANEARQFAEDAVNTAAAAEATANQAVGLATAPTDAAVNAVLTNPASDASATLSAAIAAARTDRGDGLMAALDQKRDAVLAVLGDSTAYKNGSGNYVGTDGNEWPKQVSLALAAMYGSARVGYRLLSSGTTYASEQVLQAGATGTIQAQDTFTRSAADLVGSTSDSGAVWASSSAGKYSVDGSKALFANGATGVTAHRLPAAAPGKLTTSASLTFVADGGGAHTGPDSYHLLSSYIDGSNFLWITVNATASADTSTINFKKSTTAGGTVTLASKTFTDAGVTITLGPQTVPVSIAHVGDNVTYAFGTATGTYALTSGESAAFAAATAGGFWGARNDHSWDNFTITTPATPARLDVYNGAMGSQNADWSRTNVAALLPVAPDAVVITHSHNHATETPATFEAELDDLVAAIRTLHGDGVAIIIGGQNPQYSPTANPAEHNARQADLRRYARVRGFGYVPIFEAFMSQANPQSLVRADGVHPTTAGIDLIGDTVESYLVGLSLAP